MALPQRMTTHQIHQVYIADGFADDCEELIHRWLRTDMLTYETFCEIWKDMQFDSIFYGRPTGAEMAELSEEVINIAKHYMVSNTDNFEESVAGLFLVYALLNLQPYPGFAALRVVPEDVAAISRIEAVARHTRRYDVLYILGSVLVQGPVQYQAVARERGMEASFRKYLDGTTGIDRVGVRPKGVFYRQNEELDLLRELNNITRRYVEAKKNVPGSSQSLNYTNENLATELDTSLKGIINGILDEGDEGNKKLSEHYSTVQAIKEKAMRQTVDGVKFLSSAADRSPPATAIVEKPIVVDTPPDNKPAPRKGFGKKCIVRANKYKSQRRKRPGPRYSSSSSTESLDLSSEEDQMSQDTESSDDSFTFNKLMSKKRTMEVGAKEIEIEIERLPVLIRSEQDGNLYEIEVIDEMNEDQGSVNSVPEVPLNAKEGTSKDDDGKVVPKKTKSNKKVKTNVKKAGKKMVGPKSKKRAKISEDSKDSA